MECSACRGVGEVMKYVLPGEVGMTKCLQCGGTGAVYAPPKLREYPMTGKMHKAAIEAAKHEASCEILDMVVDLFTGRDADVEGYTLILEVLRTWQQIHEEGKRKALDAFVVLVQEKLRAETAARL